MYLNEAFIIACMLAEQNKVLLKVFVIILSYLNTHNLQVTI